MNISPDTDIKKIFEKSVRLLNDKQARLMDMQQLLKKAVIRLSHSSRSDNAQVNAILDGVDASVDEHVDLKKLNKELDNLFVIVNHADYKHSSVTNVNFYDYIKDSIDNLENAATKNEYIARLQLLVDDKVTNEEMSSQIIDCIQIFSIDKYKQQTLLDEFINNITDGTDFKYEKNNLDISNILEDLSVALIEYIYTIKNNKKSDGKDVDANLNHAAVNFNDILLEIVNQLTLPNEAKAEQFKLAKMLHRSKNNKETWIDAIQDLVGLINKSIGKMQQEKQDLQSYLTKINLQLADIESFIHVLRQGSEDAESRSLMLTESVEQGLSSLEETVEQSTDLTHLKKDVSEKLTDIRQYVEEYKKESDDVDHISAASYAQVIDELVHSQKESHSLKEQLEESKIQLLRDPLTGAPNRLAYEECITVEVDRWKRHKRPLCIAMWDIDFFKKVNDDYGHSVGDRVLKLFAEIIQSRIRKIDLFARIGGEEFVLIMPDTSIETALKLNEKLRKQIENCNFHYGENHCPITASVGIADFNENDTPEYVMEKADEALYKSKNNGRNRCTVFDKDVFYH